VDKVLDAADIPIFHFPAKKQYSISEIQSTIFDILSDL
jgi:hypothetical protein